MHACPFVANLESLRLVVHQKANATSGELWLHFAHVVVKRLRENQKLVRNVVLRAMECLRSNPQPPAETARPELTTSRLVEISRHLEILSHYPDFMNDQHSSTARYLT